MGQHITSGLCWWRGRQAITAMKENVATRMAAHDRMKMMWLSAVKTVVEIQINYWFRMEEINAGFIFMIWGIFTKNMTETLMLWRPFKKNASSLSLWLLGVKLPLLPQNFEIIGKKGGLTTVVGFSECTWPLQRKLGNELPVYNQYFSPPHRHTWAAAAASVYPCWSGMDRMGAIVTSLFIIPPLLAKEPRRVLGERTSWPAAAGTLLTMSASEPYPN